VSFDRRIEGTRDVPFGRVVAKCCGDVRCARYGAPEAAVWGHAERVTWPCATCEGLTLAKPRTRLTAAVLGSPDPRALAAFDEKLLGWMRVADEPARPGAPPEDGWVVLRPPTGGTGLSFQYEPHYVSPVWPTAPDEQQMMVHLDFAVANLDDAVAWACELGAVLADHQPQEHVRVMRDPDGHPFCVFPGEV
jgi:catechol 2,3-dioxygenase-like lactoylglutathione lyase family enzyme